MTVSEIQNRADFSAIRYAKCWEDSDLLVGALEPAGRDCLSIGSAGDNSFALLAAGAKSVTAVEMNPTQVACIELRHAAYLNLNHGEFLELHGSRASSRREKLYARCRGSLSGYSLDFWDAHAKEIEGGIGGCGKFENYFRLFRSYVLPLAHSRKRVGELLRHRPEVAVRREDQAGMPELLTRAEFYERVWNNWRWRAIFKVFFSRTMMGALGRDPEFFKYVEGSVADRILARTKHAIAVLDPSVNPYLHWILTGTHGADLPAALKAENYEKIRRAIRDGKFRVVNSPIEALFEAEPAKRFDAYNLSDIFEYMSEANTAALLGKIVEASNDGARLAYWNMLAPRSRPEAMATVLKPLPELAEKLFLEDRAFFYSRFVVEEVVK
jgi:S-adenosylmethionine-diacylglycerol 3-amino-3-carboxypropyl transferase